MRRAEVARSIAAALMQGHGRPGLASSEVEVAAVEADDATLELAGFIDGGGDLASDNGMDLLEAWMSTSDRYVDAVVAWGRQEGRLR